MYSGGTKVWTPRGLKSPSAVYFSAVTNFHPHAAPALFCPAQNWMLQRDDDTSECKSATTTTFMILAS